MSNNNERNQNNHVTRSNNFNDNRRNNKVKKVNPNEITIPLYLPADLDENIINEIIDVLESTKFNKISVPLGTYRYLIDSNANADDDRISTIGYIRNYNKETKEFTVITFGRFAELLKEKNCTVIELMFTIYKDSLGTITKFNFVPSVSPSVDDIDN